MDYRTLAGWAVWKLAVLSFILALIAHAQVQPVQFQGIQVLTPAGIIIAQLHPSIVLDLTGPVPILRAVVPAAPKPRQTDVFSPGTAYTFVTLSLAPDSIREVRVYRNGLLMAPTVDYTRAGQVVTFTAAQGTADTDIVQVSYGPA